MKKIYVILMMIVMIITSSCGVSRHSYIEQDARNTYILGTYYPELLIFYNEGVLRVNSIHEVRNELNEIDYLVDYDFVRRYYNSYSERVAIVREYFPDIYMLYTSGMIRITSAYKYVDVETRSIHYSVSYRHIHDSYYYYMYDYPGGHYSRGRIRAVPNLPPPPPRRGNNPPPPSRDNVRPNNQSHNNPPRDNVRPNNPPRNEGNVRPNNPPRNDSRPNTNPPAPRNNNSSSSRSNSNVNPSRSTSSSSGASRSSGGGNSSSRSGSSNSRRR